MHEKIDGPLNPLKVRNELATLRSRPGDTDPEAEKAVRAKLATAKIDKAIREAMSACPVPLHPAQVQYLIARIEQSGK